MRGQASVQIGAAAGMAWGLLSVSRLPLTGEFDRPNWDAPVDEIVSFYESADFDTAFALGIAMPAAGYALLVVFAAVFATLMSDRDPGLRWLGVALVGGAILEVALVVGYLSTFAAAVFWSSSGGLGADGYLVLHGVSFSFYWVGLITSNLWTVPLGISILLTGVLPKPLGWIWLANSAALPIGYLLSVDVWNAVSGLLYIWLLISSVLLLRPPISKDAASHSMPA